MSLAEISDRERDENWYGHSKLASSWHVGSDFASLDAMSVIEEGGGVVVALAGAYAASRTKKRIRFSFLELASGAQSEVQLEGTWS